MIAPFYPVPPSLAVWPADSLGPVWVSRWTGADGQHYTAELRARQPVTDWVAYLYRDVGVHTEVWRATVATPSPLPFPPVMRAQLASGLPLARAHNWVPRLVENCRTMVAGSDGRVYTPQPEPSPSPSPSPSPRGPNALWYAGLLAHEGGAVVVRGVV